MAAKKPSGPLTERTEQDFEKMEWVMEKMVGTLNHFKKMERQIMNEPESETKYARVELMRKVIAQLSEPVNYWENYRKKCQRKLLEEAEAKLKADLKAKFERDQKEAFEQQHKPKAYNTKCRHYCLTIRGTRDGNVQEHSCGCGMDMTYCGKTCAFATNAVRSTPAYEAPITLNNRRVRKHD